MPETKMLGSNHDVLQRTSHADEKFTLIGVGNLEPAGMIHQQINGVVVDTKLPRFGIVARRDQNRISNEEFDLLPQRRASGKQILIDSPRRDLGIEVCPMASSDHIVAKSDAEAIRRNLAAIRGDNIRENQTKRHQPACQQVVVSRNSFPRLVKHESTDENLTNHSQREPDGSHE